MADTPKARELILRPLYHERHCRACRLPEPGGNEQPCVAGCCLADQAITVAMGTKFTRVRPAGAVVLG